MALDTTIGGASAESYVTVAAADAYHTARKNAAWTGAADVKEAALRKATAYLDSMYTFQGIKASEAQRLLWPRNFVSVDDYAVPADAYHRRLTDACCELALKAIAGELAADISPQVVTAEAVGPLSVEYSDVQRDGGRVRYDYVESLIGPLLVNGGGRGNIPLVRA